MFPCIVSADNLVLKPDITFHFICLDYGDQKSKLENLIEEFIVGQKFSVLNLESLRREHGVYLEDINILGIDSSQRMIEFVSLPFDSRYAVRLLSPPPTVHDLALEEALVGFASKTLGCEVRQLRRNENGPDVLEFHRSEVRRVESLFQQAEQLRGQRRI
jgi:hypothetical protein